MTLPSRPDPSTLPIARFPEEWALETVRLGGRSFHGKQVFKWIHARGVSDASAMTDLPVALREKLTAEGLTGVLSIVTERRAADHTRKLLVGMHDGTNVETVLIPRLSAGKSTLPSPFADGGEPVFEDADAAAAVDDEEEDETSTSTSTKEAASFVSVTQCISTQVGCAMGCVFCASGVAGLKRHMRADEIIAQVILGRSRLDANERIRNVVLMGMGEPLHNYDQTVRALRLLSHPDGIALSNRKVTVSTSGLVPEIARLGVDFGGKIGLAISLHAADDETRSRLMPINKKYPLAALMQALREYPLPPRRKITIEYTLVAGKNDTVAEAQKLTRLLRGLAVKVNLIPMNPIEASTLGPPNLAGVLAFQRVLVDAGYACFIRRRRGDDVSAACGQLALLGAKPKVRVNRT